ncbi:VOC family protein [Maricaulis sp.]|uniref:VOC family protein n=1 Tax=Maricaulis sp. TaxID=1486257 RepID=UPI0025C34636|nr:VOC family protein [Maricaulis sp.]
MTDSETRTRPANDHQGTPVASGVTPHLTTRDALAAVRFYKAAFGAELVFCQMAEDEKRVLHGHLVINGGSVFLHDDFPEYRGGALAPVPAGIALHMQVDDIDAWWDRAVRAGAEITMPLADMFWGDRYGQLKDPWGYVLSLAATSAQADREGPR